MSDYIINNIKDRYDIRYKINKMINLKLRHTYNNNLNLYGNLNAFFIFINLFYKKDIIEQLEIFDNECEIYINDIQISLSLFFKKIIYNTNNNIKYYFNIKLLKITNNNIYIDNKLNIQFNKYSKIIKFKLYNDSILSIIDNTNLKNINNNIIKEYDINNIININEFSNNLLFCYKSIFIYNFNLENNKINELKIDYKNTEYLLYERNLTILSLFYMYTLLDKKSYNYLFVYTFLNKTITKVNNIQCNIYNLLLKMGFLTESLSNINYDIIKIQLIDEYNIELEYLLSGNYTKQYIHNDIIMREPENEKITSHLIKAKIKFNEENKICEYSLSSHNKDLTFEEIIFDNISEREESIIETEEPIIETEEPIIEKEESTD